MTEVVREPVPGLSRVPTPVPAADTVTCPECGTRSVLDLLRRDASGFCPQCDFPLFWADRGTARGDAQDADDAPTRRLPGVEGELAGPGVVCPVCGEHNAHVRRPCVRCGGDLTPPAPLPAPVPPAPEPEPHVVQVPVPVPCAHPRTWVVALVSALLGAGVAFVVTVLVLG